MHFADIVVVTRDYEVDHITITFLMSSTHFGDGPLCVSFEKTTARAHFAASFNYILYVSQVSLTFIKAGRACSVWFVSCSHAYKHFEHMIACVFERAA